MVLDTEALICDIRKALEKLILVDDVIPTEESIPGSYKSIRHASIFSEAGTRFFEEKKFDEAVSSYTMSIAHSPEDSEELSQAYANRSAVLFELTEYEECLLDVHRALKGKCSLVLRKKLHGRKERCLAKIQSSTCTCAAEIAADETYPTERKPTWRDDMLGKFKNPLLPNASPKIKLKYDEKWGRHFVATADIEPGETLMSEEFFVAMPILDGSCYKFCDFCVTQCRGLIPCPSCTRTLYCSEHCRTRAYDSYHRVECKLIPELFYLPLDEAIAIRMFLVGTEQGAALQNLMNVLSVSNIFEENYNFADKPFTNDYFTALKTTTKPIDPTFVKSHIEDAIEVVCALRKLAFFENVSDDRSEEAQVFAVALLLNNYQSRYLDSELVTDKEGGCCRGLRLLQYMLNHACYPNVCNYIRKRESIVYATRPIKKDEQLFRSYCYDFVCLPKEERVKNFDFICKCDACSHNWPTSFETSRFSDTVPGIMFAKIIESSTAPIQKRHEHLFSEFTNCAAPFLDDVILTNLQVHELKQIVIKMVTVLCELMKPMSFTLLEFQSQLVKLVEMFYDDRECNPHTQRELNFSNLFSSEKEDELLTLIDQCPVQIDEFYVLGIITIMKVIYRLRFYLSGNHFIYKKIVG